MDKDIALKQSIKKYPPVLTGRTLQLYKLGCSLGMKGIDEPSAIALFPTIKNIYVGSGCGHSWEQNYLSSFLNGIRATYNTNLGLESEQQDLNNPFFGKKLGTNNYFRTKKVYYIGNLNSGNTYSLPASISSIKPYYQEDFASLDKYFTSEGTSKNNLKSLVLDLYYQPFIVIDIDDADRFLPFFKNLATQTLSYTNPSNPNKFHLYFSTDKLIRKKCYKKSRGDRFDIDILGNDKHNQVFIKNKTSNGKAMIPLSNVMSCLLGIFR